MALTKKTSLLHNPLGFILYKMSRDVYAYAVCVLYTIL